MIVGQPAPGFSLEAVADGAFTTVDLDDYRDQWLVVLFYPLDFTFVCPTELLAYSDRLDELTALGAWVVGVSIDSKFSHLAWTNQGRREGGVGGLRFPLLSDQNRTMASDYGVLTDEGVALRGLFLIDPDGVVQHATVNNLAVGRSVDETRRVIAAFRHARDHGEVCPAGWQSGDDGMRADPIESLEWFEQHGESAA